MSARLPENHDVLRSFRLEIIRGLRLITLIVGSIGLVISVYLALSNNNPAAAIGLIALYLLTTAIFWLPGIPEVLRLFAISGLCYLFAINALLNLGPIGAGRLWLIAFAGVSGAFLGFRAGMVAMVVSTLTYVAYAMAVTANLLSLPPMIQMTPEMWLDQLFDIPLFSLIVTLPGIYLISGLRKRFEAERSQHRELSSVNAELKTLNDDLQAFDYSVSNALRAPLRRLTGYLKLLEDEQAAPAAEKRIYFLGKVKQMTGELDELLNGLLVLSRVKRMQMVRVWQDLDAMVQTVLLEYRETEPQRSVHVDLQPGLQVFADQFMFRQVVISLIDNAWKYTRTSRLPRISINSAIRDSRRVLRFSDNGIGIKQEDRDAIFEPFHAYHTRGDFSTAGLSLPITRRIVERHGGTIHVEENEDDGATFIITFGPDDEWLRVAESGEDSHS